MTRNAEVARVLKEIGLLLEIEGKDKFKPRAYNRGMRSIASLGEDIESVAKRDALTDIPGIGKGLSEVIKSYLETGEVELLTELRTRVPVKVLELDSIPGVGPKTIKLVYDKLGVTDLGTLEKAANGGKLSGLPGLGEKTQVQIIEGIKLVIKGSSVSVSLKKAITSLTSDLKELEKVFK